MNIKKTPSPSPLFRFPLLALVFTVVVIVLIFLFNDREPTDAKVVVQKGTTQAATMASQRAETDPDIQTEAAVKLSARRTFQQPQHSGDPPVQPEIINDAIDAMSRDEIIGYVLSKTSYSEEDLSTFSDVAQFAKKLDMLESVGDAEKDNPQPAIYGSIIFSTSNVWAMGQDMSATAFPAETHKIFAMLPIIENIGKAVFVRWYQNGEDYPLLFNKYGVKEDISRNHIWIGSSVGWSAGTYTIDIYTDDEYLDYLATGSYEIL